MLFLFLYAALFYYVGISFRFLIWSTAATAKVVDEPLPTQLDPFKISMKIVERVMDNCYFGDGTVHPGNHLLYIHELCGLFQCAGISMDIIKRKLFTLSLDGRAADRKSTRLNSSHRSLSRMPSSA